MYLFSIIIMLSILAGSSFAFYSFYMLEAKVLKDIQQKKRVEIFNTFK